MTLESTISGEEMHLQKRGSSIINVHFHDSAPRKSHIIADFLIDFGSRRGGGFVHGLGVVLLQWASSLNISAYQNSDHDDYLESLRSVAYVKPSRSSKHALLPYGP